MLMVELLLSIAIWAVFAPLTVALTIITWLISPLLPMFTMTAADGHRWLVKPLRWFQTHDAPLDEMWKSGQYDAALPTGLAARARAGNRPAQYRCEAAWLRRNSAYGFAHYAFGFQAVVHLAGDFIVPPTVLWHVQRGRWDSGRSNLELLVIERADGAVAWMLNAQWFYMTTRFVRIRFGWKLERTDADGRRMIAAHVNPVRPWSAA
jgi:hypothetical protein